MKTRILLLAIAAIGCNDGRMTLGEAARELADCHAAVEAIEQQWNRVEVNAAREVESGGSASEKLSILADQAVADSSIEAGRVLRQRIKTLTLSIGSGNLPPRKG